MAGLRPVPYWRVTQIKIGYIYLPLWYWKALPADMTKPKQSGFRFNKHDAEVLAMKAYYGWDQ